MNWLFKLVLFSIAINFATGLLLYTVVVPDGNGGFTPLFGGQLGAIPAYQEGYVTSLTSEFGNESISPSGLVEDKGNALYRVLDMIGLGFIEKLLQAVDDFMYGFVNLLKAMIGDKLQGGDFFFGLLKTIITIGYIFAAFKLWTDRDILT